MPTYQYACTACDERLEAVQSFSDAALTECPACGGRLRKVFSAVGVVFKGSGFYKNDSRDTGGKKPATVGADSSGKDSGGKESSGKESSSKDSGGKESAPSAPATSSSGTSSGSGSSTGTPAAPAKKSAPAAAGKAS